MYECDCDNLSRTMPFRDLFTDRVIQDIEYVFPTTKHPVYVSQGAGGLLFDYLLLQKLIQRGFKAITVIVIEELYQEKESIIQACLDFKSWCADIAPLVQVKPHFFSSIGDYAFECSQNPKIRGDLLVTVDPDDKKTIPNFDSKNFLKKFSYITSSILKEKASFYYLFYQNNYRHMILGRVYENKKIIAYEHSSGTKSLNEKKHNRVFIQQKEMFPFESIQNGIQIGSQIQTSQELYQLLKNPLNLAFE